MFLLNSRLGLFSVAALRRLPFSLSYGVILPSSLTTLLPSACGYSPRLPVSVCGTGTHSAIAAFLGSVGTAASLLVFAPRRASPYPRGFSSAVTASRLPGSFRSPVRFPSCVPAVLGVCGAGISTSCPSATALALALGPDLPWADWLDPGNLRLPAYMVLAYISLLIPAFSLPLRPRSLPLPLRPRGLLPYQWSRQRRAPFQSFGGVFEPRLSSAQDLSTSVLLRTL